MDLGQEADFLLVAAGRRGGEQNMPGAEGPTVALHPHLLGSRLVPPILGPAQAFHPPPLRWGLVCQLLVSVQGARAACSQGGSDLASAWKQLRRWTGMTGELRQVSGVGGWSVGDAGQGGRRMAAGVPGSCLPRGLITYGH